MSAGASDVHLDLTGRTVAMTGGTGVLGRVLVTALVRAGANVALIVRDTRESTSALPRQRGA